MFFPSIYKTDKQDPVERQEEISKGILRGEKMSDITVIGGIRANITVNAAEQLMAEQENKGTIEASYSGTGRNIAENLGRMGANTALIAVAGADFVGKGAKEELDALGVNTELLTMVEGQNTAMNISVLNIIGDLEFAAANADVYDCLSETQIADALEKINSSKVVCVDGTLKEGVLRYLAENVNTTLFFDPNSEEDAEKAKTFIGSFDIIKPNRAEASALCGMDIFSEEQLKEAGQWFVDQGVKKVFITMSGGGVYYREGAHEGILHPEKVLPFVYEKGAGDAFSAAIADGTAKEMDIEATAAYGMKAAAIAMECKAAVNPAMSRKKLENENC